MLRQDILPPKFKPIAHLVKNVHKESQNEFHGSCPRCGKTFLMFVIEKHDFAFGICSECDFSWSSSKKLSKEQFNEWRKVQIEVLKKRIESSSKALDDLQNDNLWEEK